MKQRLNLYTINMKYIRNLSKKDGNVPSVSPQINKDNRPLVGLLLMLNGRKYCAPLSSPKAKHHTMKENADFLKVYDKHSVIIAVINFNNMIPVEDSVISQVDVIIRPSDRPNVRYYKGLLNNQIDWCNQNSEKIIKKARRLYQTVTNPNKNTSIQLLKRCCNFAVLERELDKYVGNYLYFKTDARGIEQLKGIDAQIEIHNAKEKGYYIVRTIVSDAETVAHALHQNLPENKISK